MTNTVKVTSRVTPLGVWQDIPSDSINSAIIVFEFADDWADLVCTAQFTQGNKTYNQLIDDNQCAVPVELHTGEFKLSVFGAKTDGTAYRSTTVPLIKDVMQSGFDGEGETPIPPTPDLYAQLIEEFANGGVHSLNGIKGDMSLVAGDNTAVSVDTDNKEISIDVTVDSAMSDTSENAVQNKVVKDYIDTEIANIPVDDALSDASENPVQNKVITNQINSLVNALPQLYEALSNKVTAISEDSTDTQYPSAKCIYDLLVALQGYVDTEVAKKLDLAGGTLTGDLKIASGARIAIQGSASNPAITMSNKRIAVVGAPSVATDAATKGYVDNAIASAIGIVNTTLATLATVEEGE